MYIDVNIGFSSGTGGRCTFGFVDKITGDGKVVSIEGGGSGIYRADIVDNFGGFGASTPELTGETWSDGQPFRISWDGVNECKLWKYQGSAWDELFSFDIGSGPFVPFICFSSGGSVSQIIVNYTEIP